VLAAYGVMTTVGSAKVRFESFKSNPINELRFEDHNFHVRAEQVIPQALDVVQSVFQYFPLSRFSLRECLMVRFTDAPLQVICFYHKEAEAYLDYRPDLGVQVCSQPLKLLYAAFGRRRTSNWLLLQTMQILAPVLF